MRSGSETNKPTKRNLVLILEDAGTTHPSFSSCGGLGSPLYPFGGLGHTCIHVYMHIGIHGYIDTCIHAKMHTSIHAYIYTCIDVHMHTCIHAFMHIYIHAYMHTCIHACIHIYIHAYMHN